MKKNTLWSVFLVATIINASILSVTPMTNTLFIGCGGSFIFALICVCLLGYGVGQEHIFENLSREVDMESVPVKGERDFVITARISFLNGKRVNVQLVTGTTTLEHD